MTDDGTGATTGNGGTGATTGDDGTGATTGDDGTAAAASTRDAADDVAPEPAEQRAAVRDRYGRIATESGPRSGGDDESTGGSPGCDESDGGDGGCCDPDAGQSPGSSTHCAQRRGYADEDLAAVEAGADLGLGCGNPTAVAGLEVGEAVLDLGSGAGLDCVLAAREVGPTGRVVGVDMTPEMVERARENAAANDAAANDAATVEFRLGEIEHLPVADESVDVVVSNCAVNLSPDPSQVFRETHRVLRPGGRLAISDVVATAPIPAEWRADLDSVAGCVGGASTVPALESMLTAAGFENVSVDPNADGETVVREWDPDRDPSDYVLPATIRADKPATTPH